MISTQVLNIKRQAWSLVLSTDESDQDYDENIITVTEQSGAWEDLFCGRNKKVLIFIFVSIFHTHIYIFVKKSLSIISSGNLLIFFSKSMTC